MKTIGIAIDRQRTYGRRLCQGIVGYARAHTDWTLRIVEFDELERASRVADCDGFIARVLNDRLAERLAATPHTMERSVYQRVEAADVQKAYDRFNPRTVDIRQRRAIGFCA